MKTFAKLPFSLNKVKGIAKLYNKAFHTKVFTLFASSESEIQAFAQLHQPHFDFCLVFIKNYEGLYFLDNKGLEKVRGWVIEQATANPEKIFQMYRDWEKSWNIFIKLSRKLLSQDLAEFSDAELFRQFENFYESYKLAGGLAYICDSFLSSGQSDWLEKLMSEELKKMGKTDNPAEDVRLLTFPTKPSFALEEEYRLSELAEVFK